MSPRGLNTILVQRIETALGVTLSQQTQLARGATPIAVAQAAKAAGIDRPESATGKPVFAHDLANKAAHRAGHGQPVTRSTDVASQARTSISPSAGNAPSPATGSTQMHLSQVGRVLYSLFDEMPQGGGPIKAAHPLFISAVIHLRTQAAARVLDMEGNPAGKSNQPSNATNATGATSAAATAAMPSGSSFLASALQQILLNSISQSGLFYESHLLRALRAGPEHLDKVRQEPQNQRHVSSEYDVDSDIEGAPQAHEIRTIVRQQLDILAGQPIQWQGLAWPDAPMRWEIRPWGESDTWPPREDDADREGQSDQAWTSTLNLTLPAFGNVVVQIWIRNQDVRLRIDASENNAELTAHVELFQDQLEKAGISAPRIEIASFAAEKGVA